MRVLFIGVLIVTLFISGCSFLSPDEKEIKEMLKIFTTSLNNGDEVLARAILIDVDGFRILNPDIKARVDSESFTETVMAELIHSFRGLKFYFNGRELKYKSLTLGDQWYQYKGRQAFKDNVLTITADGETIDIPIKGIVSIEGEWRIVDLSGIGFVQ